MSTPVLLTKLFVPRPRPDAVTRPRLIERLNAGLHGELSLIAAPAGFGKTTLVSAWVEGIGRPVAWLSLDEGDNDPTRFLLHLVAAVQTNAPNLGEGVMAALQSPQPATAESTLSELVNEIKAIPNNFVLVLDDYHVIDAPLVDRALTFLLEHLPPQLHLVMATREDPPLPLARLRARGQLTELRAADLRFTDSEAANFLNEVMGLNLSAEDVAALEDRTEGWIAGLQLAALSLQDRQDVSGFIRAFAGDHRYVVDYLVDEVLQRQPQDIRRFLLRTSILDRLTGPLCDAVTGQQGGAARLEALERGNFFLAPLDDQRRWYRYHRLFADILSAHLIAEQPEEVPTLHRRAGAWYERHGSPADAIRHALAGQDFERAAWLIERAVPEVRRTRQETTLLGWLKALPNELVQARPVLSVAYAWALLASGDLEDVEARLRDAERRLDPAADRRAMAVVDEEEFRRVPAAIALYRGVLAQIRGDVAAAVFHARRAFDLVPEDDDLGRGAAAALLGLASWTSGDLETARRTYAKGMARVQQAGNVADALGGSIASADILRAQGRLREAMRTYERALQLAAEQGEPVPRGTADLYIGVSELYREQNDLDAATQYLLRSKELAERTGLPHNGSRWCAAMARLREAQGDLDGALDLLGEAERRHVADFSPQVRPIAPMKTRVWLRQGRVGDALGWAREQGLSAEDQLSYLREFEHITLARVLLAQYEGDRSDNTIRAVLVLLDRLLQAAEDGGRTGSANEILIVQALAHQAQGDIPAALLPLERALTLAEPEGYVRIFIDEGPPMADLLREAAARGIVPAYANRLLSAFEAEQQRRADQSSVLALPVSQPLIEPLSARELEVLRLLRSELSGPEIARELVVALSTVRTHTKRIYGKLGVTNRRAAVTRATELGLI